MRQIVLLSVSCLMLFACGGGGGTPSATAPCSDPLNPTQALPEQPPTNGQLPANLVPPT